MYVKRDSEERIVAVSAEPEAGCDEHLEPGDPDLENFLARIHEKPSAHSAQVERLRSSDVELARVVEDIINLLTDKGVIQFTELPDAAQKKLLQRKRLRRKMHHLDLVSDDDSEQLIP